VYDTEPVCRAVVTARILRPDFDLFKVFRAYQHAFYVEAADTTDRLALAEIGSRALSTLRDTVSADEFLRTWKLQSTIDKTVADFAIARAMGVTSFPNLFLKKSERLYQVSDGYTSVEQMENVLSLIAA
ncbi:MAG TPA: hypothetical protein VJQ54_20075, partial [Candidatus Sulfotelmatobacter sp.]|nr:hypothetical protein [Candidatus Sulfotelmatobacter sp.]